MCLYFVIVNGLSFLKMCSVIPIPSSHRIPKAQQLGCRLKFILMAALLCSTECSADHPFIYGPPPSPSDLLSICANWPVST